MEVRRVKKCRKNRVFFEQGNDLERPSGKLQYKSKDIVFVKNTCKEDKIEKYHAYESMMNYLNDNEKNRINFNKCLLINKFTNIFNLDERYLASYKEQELLKSLKSNREVIKNTLEKDFEWLQFYGKVNNKMVIGLGNQSVFETSITLHYTYGIPYIPASAIKGVLKSYIIAKYFKEYEENCDKNCENECDKWCEKSANSDEIFIRIFGGKNKEGKNVQGNVIFMDAFPSKNYSLQRDVMTPHHKAYFSDLDNIGYVDNSKLPKDSDEPNPIFFLVVDDSNEFEFNIAISKKIEDNISNKDMGKLADVLKNKEIKEFIKENMIEALNFNGIGAKTSVGYGFFNIGKEKSSK